MGIRIETDQQAVQHDLGTFIRINSELYECWHTAGQQQQLQAALPEAEPGTLNDWRLAQIDAGIGQVTAATSGEWIPQMLNYQLEPVRGVSFTKGCYTGQEIVARMQYRGKLKRHMYRLDSPVELPPGTPLFTPGSEQSAGEVVMCGSTATGSRLLAVATSAAVAADHLFANSCGVTPLHRLSLPYELPDSTAE
jgi:folate-binding protein YgfZ